MNIQEDIKQLLLRPKVVKHIVTLYHHYRTNCYVISYPKCGRTWLRVMLAKTFALYFGDPREIVYEPIDVIKKVRAKGPIVTFTHDGSARPPTAKIEQSEKRYQRYRHKKVIFLIRDPRDAIVSYYFERSQRQKESHKLSDFIRHPWWGIDRMITFMRGWYEHRNIPLDFLLVRYEDMHCDPNAELRKILNFLDLNDVSDEIIQSAVDYASFSNMRKISVSHLRNWDRLSPADPQNPESFKVRRGEVGGYKRYLSSDDVKYIEGKMRRELPSSFGYTGFGD